MAQLECRIDVAPLPRGEGLIEPETRRLDLALGDLVREPPILVRGLRIDRGKDLGLELGLDLRDADRAAGILGRQANDDIAKFAHVSRKLLGAEAGLGGRFQLERGT
jgi:hypothetical protein